MTRNGNSLGRHARGIAAAAALALGLASGAALAAPGDAQGGPITVASYTAEGVWSDFPWVARDATGNFIAVWLRHTSDSSAWDILGQRYTPDGLPLGATFQVNQSPLVPSFAQSPNNPRAAMTPQGDLVVVWDAFGNGVSSVRGRRYAPNGAPVGNEFLIPNILPGRAYGPNVAINTAGEFVVVWASEQPVFIPTVVDTMYVAFARQVYAQYFRANGTRLGVPILVDSGVNYELSPPLPIRKSVGGPTVAIGPSGDFVVAWDAARADLHQVVVRGYSRLGLPDGPSFPVSATSLNREKFPQIAMDAAGNFVVVWNGDTTIVAHKFFANGVSAGAQFELGGGGAAPVVAMDPLGNFAVCWWGGASGVSAQLFSANLTPLTGAFPAFPGVSGERKWPSIAMDAGGNFVVVGQVTTLIPHRSGIVAQRFVGP